MAVKLKSWNWQTVAIGRPGSGKSFWMRRAAWAEAHRVGAYLVVHDPTGSYDEDRRVPHRRYPSTTAAAAGLGEHGGRVAHIIDVGDADVALQFAIAAAAASIAQAKGGKYHPVLFVCDEAVSAGGVRSHGLTPLWMGAIARRRHLGIGLGITSQSAFFAHRSVLSLATQIEVFGLSDPADEKRLVAVGLDPKLAPTLRGLPDRAHITIVNGRTVGRSAPVATNRREG